jgi:glycerol-3-phosphate dehydrogenase
VAEGIDVTRAEFEFAVTHEAALDVEDILDRRTRIGLVAAERERTVAAAQEMLAAAH